MVEALQPNDNIKGIKIDWIKENYSRKISEFFEISLKDFSSFLKVIIEKDANFKSIYYKLYVLNLPLYSDELEEWEKIREKIIENWCKWLMDDSIRKKERSIVRKSAKEVRKKITVEKSAEDIWKKCQKEIREFFVMVWKNVSPFFWKLDHREVYDFMNLYYKRYILKFSLNEEENKEWNRIWKKVQECFCNWLRETYIKSIKDSDKWDIHENKKKVPEWEYELSNDAKDFFLKNESSFKPYYMKLAIGEIPLFQYLYYKKYVLKEPLSEDEEKKWNDLKEKIWLKDEQENEDRGG